ncbi:TetR family transcriptional regulator [Promicromonospora iranensis]|uniref:AcrR family transcriptional regulator n=1 Tax=Promicromonospora iranensis TaxID=1105144 RepID=A0ABU2CHZ1_9MICO|nr:TetR family transcriptional regulator [Promicromonospora iranensis]MDR7380944.1 AcrR family transcriptional regulator [Promicromonospora iranensis]
MPSTTSSGPSLREISRDAVRARITEVALDLFAERGFDQVTVDQIAAAAGMSGRTFHRYFPAKEDVVVGEPERWGEFVRDAFAARPADEPVWDSLLASFEAFIGLLAQDGRVQRGKVGMRILVSTASLRARNLEKHQLWGRMLLPLVAARLPDDGDTALRAEIIVQASLACLDVAFTTWADVDDDTTISELLERSFAMLRPTA